MCVCVCVCVSVTTLAAVLLISILEPNYEQLYHDIFFIFNSLILIKMLRSEVMVSFATLLALYTDRLRRYSYRGDITIAVRNAAIAVQVANCAHSPMY